MVGTSRARMRRRRSSALKPARCGSTHNLSSGYKAPQSSELEASRNRSARRPHGPDALNGAWAPPGNAGQVQKPSHSRTRLGAEHREVPSTPGSRESQGPAADGRNCAPGRTQEERPRGGWRDIAWARGGPDHLGIGIGDGADQAKDAVLRDLRCGQARARRFIGLFEQVIFKYEFEKPWLAGALARRSLTPEPSEGLPPQANRLPSCRARR